ncbi:MAG: hypothetical protein WBV77_15665 [Solirubrobacteraceae bacterium]
MTPEPDSYGLTPEARARIRKLLNEVKASQEGWEARAQERERMKIKSEMALERLHRANVALRAALPH